MEIKFVVKNKWSKASHLKLMKGAQFGNFVESSQPLIMKNSDKFHERVGLSNIKSSPSIDNNAVLL